MRLFEQRLRLAVGEHLRGHDDDGKVPGGRLLAQGPEHGLAGQPWHHQVEDDDIRLVPPGAVQPLFPGRRLEHVEHRLREALPHQVARDRFVVHHQDAHRRRGAGLDRGQRFEQLPALDGLDEVGVGAKSQRPVAIPADADKHDRCPLGLFRTPEPDQEGPGFLRGQRDVEDNRRRRHLGQRRGSFVHREDGVDLIRGRAQHLLVEVLRVGRFVEDEQRQPGRVRHPAERPRGLLLPGLETGGDPEKERRSDARRALDGQRTAQQLGEATRQGKPQAGPLDLALERMLDLAELLEDAGVVRRVDADAGVGHGKGGALVVSRRGGRHAHLTALGELEGVRDQVPEDLADLAVVCVKGGHAVRAVEHQRHGLVQQHRAEHAAERAEELLDLERCGTNDGLAGFHPGKVEQIVDELGQLFGRLADVDRLGLRVEAVTLPIVDEQVGESDDRVHRRAELVRHVGQEPRFEVVGAPQVIGLLVQLGVERDHAAVGVLQLAIEVRELLVLPLQFVERAEQRLVLLLNLVEQAVGSAAGDRLGDGAGAIGGDETGARRELFLEHHVRPGGARVDREPVHQPPRPHDAEAHASRRSVPAGKHVREGRDAWTAIGDADDQPLRDGRVVQREGDLPPGGITEGVPDDFGDGRGDPGLIGNVEPQQLRHLPGALPGRDGVPVVADSEGQELFHGA